MSKFGDKIVQPFIGSDFFGFWKFWDLRCFIYKKLLGVGNHSVSFFSHVMIYPHHNIRGFHKVNKYGLKLTGKTLFNEGVNIDTTGNVIIGDGVSFAEGVQVYTHVHESFSSILNEDALITPSTLEIGDGVKIGARALILNTCTHIGRYVRIGAGAVVRNNVPPYAIVVGNPAKIIGFVATPNEVEEFEKSHYSVTERIPKEVLESNYKKFFINKIKEIKDFIKQ